MYRINKILGSSKLISALIALAVLLAAVLACARSQPGENEEFFSVSGTRQAASIIKSNPNPFLLGRTPGGPVQTPTPDPPHQLPSDRQETEQYSVESGDTMGIIADKFGVSVQQLAEANKIENPDVLDVGQKLIIPMVTTKGIGPDFKVIPDSELVNSPGAIGFDIASFINEKHGFLASYSEDVNGTQMSGIEIFQRIAQNYSVSPRLLLAVLEHQSGWVTESQPQKGDRQFPIGLKNPQAKGLNRELAWAANSLNRGYYLWQVNGIANWVLRDNTSVPIAATINAGTAGVQYLFSQLYGLPEWTQAVGSEGLFATYNRLFGSPFYYAIEPLLPTRLVQPTMQLPFEEEKTWSFTGGPHGGWDTGSAWAGLDFAPPGDGVECESSDEWVTAVANGKVLRTGEGQVIQELDNDGNEQTGWVVLYMHVEDRDRVKPGTLLKAGDRIGHPSCEGGVSDGTHVHLARKYNGEWIPADQKVPFVLDGWVSSGTGKEYDGYLRKGQQTVEAYDGRSAMNNIER
jgi:LasA protease